MAVLSAASAASRRQATALGGPVTGSPAPPPWLLPAGQSQEEQTAFILRSDGNLGRKRSTKHRLSGMTEGEWDLADAEHGSGKGTAGGGQERPC